MIQWCSFPANNVNFRPHYTAWVSKYGSASLIKSQTLHFRSAFFTPRRLSVETVIHFYQIQKAKSQQPLAIRNLSPYKFHFTVLWQCMHIYPKIYSHTILICSKKLYYCPGVIRWGHKSDYKSIQLWEFRERHCPRDIWCYQHATQLVSSMWKDVYPVINIAVNWWVYYINQLSLLHDSGITASSYYWGRVSHLCVSKPPLVQTMACHLDGAKPLCEPMLLFIVIIKIWRRSRHSRLPHGRAQ